MGTELATLVTALGVWGQRWLPRRPEDEDLDLDPLLVDMRRRVHPETLPREPLVLRFEIRGFWPRFMLLGPAEVSLCTHNPGFPEPLCLRGPLPTLAAWWRGDADLAEAKRRGLEVAGPKPLAREFPDWFDRYQLAHIPPASARPAAAGNAADIPGA